MSSVNVIKATKEHLFLVPDLPFGDKSALLNGASYTMLLNGEPVGIGGVQIVWNGVGEAWVFFKPELWTANKKTLFRVVRNYLDKIIKDHYLHRVQILVLEGHIQGERLAKHLDFEHEGLMRQYGQQAENFNRFALIL